MLLAVDIGNTNITLGVWDGADWRRHWRLSSAPQRTADEYGSYLLVLLGEAALERPLDHIIIASVVPRLSATFTELSRRYFDLSPQTVNAASPLPITIDTENPAEVGADRLVNAVAASHLYPGPSIVIDMGTATTFDIVGAEQVLRGVVIAPGLAVTADALTSRAAQLSQVALTAPPQVLGRNTIHAVQSGLIYGYAGLIEGIISRLKAEWQADDVTVIGTGGLIDVIAPHTTVIDHIEPWLTLIGLQLLAKTAV